MTRHGRRNASGAISLAAMGIVGVIVMLIIAGLFAAIAHAQPMYVPPGVVIEQPHHHYAPPPPPHPYYCDRDCQWHRYHWQRERDRERNQYYYRDWR